ncbi:hypothetical protein SG34_025620 [Thalassomonas viridans]|uniref:Uncharacterized protein n=1 Tax=Thalassomonas viridans TaxID=137584 RepID=A0AAE9Z275_9GAMM|nr:hypothetical protein [Thalassomonas viridans]WDE04669.1 hypothetical protein SG34_025620 [Thalassomonas viridans]
MAILTQSGRIALAEFVASQPIFIGWGRGDVSWGDNPPAEQITSTALLDALGYRKASRVKFCQPDSEGGIEVPTGKFSLVESPTNHIYLEFNFDFDNALGETLREVGVMVDSQPKAGLPDGQYYFTPDELESTGSLMLLEHRKPLFRDQGVRETFEFVLSF